MYSEKIEELKKRISNLETAISNLEKDYEEEKNKSSGYYIGSKVIALGVALNELDFQLSEEANELDKLLRKQKKFKEKEVEKKLPKLF